MEKNEAVKIIQDTFEMPYDEGRFRRFIKEVFYKVEDRNVSYNNQYIKDAFSAYIRSYKYLFKYIAPDQTEIAVLAVHVADKHKLEKARSVQRNFIASFMETRNKQAVLVAFYTDENNKADWRFSFVRKETSFDFDTQKLSKTFTPAKRYSYLVGENETSHTAQSRLVPLLEKPSNNPTLEELESTFEVEKVSKEFFDKYKELYFRLVEELEKILTKDKKIKAEFTDRKLSAERFCKKLLGQIVFLYFIQKKGWLGVRKEQLWGNGDRRFLRTLFEKAKTESKNYFNDYLEPLFYEALATERAKHYYAQFECKIPFLNGGLFDPVNNYDWVHTDIKIPNSLFSNAEKTGILDIFDSYNFTVKEDEPLEKEVAVDPEMLGKVFEELLEIKDRKSKGAFYTPREVVHYMCQESLIHYLHTKLDKSVTLDDLSFFIRYGDAFAEFENKVGEVKIYTPVLPPSIKEHAEKIDTALADVKICDPAIGSGAFPVGLMHEIIRARFTLLNAGFIKENNRRTIYEYKRQVIQKSLYGADIDESAIEIAKLRLWLSLVVDEDNIDNIKPLPNLDYKIVCGDSLHTVKIDLINHALFKELEELKNKHFDETRKSAKDALDAQIWDKIKILTEDGKFDFRVFFSEIFGKTTGDDATSGFDIVIGNPPYVQLQKEGGALSRLYGPQGKGKKAIPSPYKTFDSMGDIYSLFYERGFQLLKPQGRLCFITSNKWMRAGYGENTRKFFSEDTNPELLIDFAGVKIFESATVDTNILMLSKVKNRQQTRACIIKKDGIKDLSVFIRQNATHCHFGAGSWVILSPIEQRIKAKIEAVGTPLKEWDISINYGIKTGFNDAFIIDGAKKDELIAADPKSEEIIRPLLRGRDIKRYGYDFADQYLITTFPSLKIDIEKFPAIKAHLLSFGYDRLKQTGDQGARKKTHNKWFETQDSINYWEDFYKQKIVWGNLNLTASFSFAPEGIFINAPCPLIVPASSYLLAILNSKVADYYIRNLGVTRNGGYFEYKPMFIEKLPVPFPDKELEKKIEKLLSAKNYRAIDVLIYDLYGLDKDEIEFMDFNKALSCQ